MRRKMLPPLPHSGESEHDRFKRFAKAILAVPKSELPTPEQAIERLEAQKDRIDAKIAEVRQKIGKPESPRRTSSRKH